jgi:predicted esterase
MVGFSTSDYLQTSYRTGNNQIASGLFVWMQVPVFGIRVTPPSGGTMGFDPISISALVDEPAAPSGSLSARSDFTEVWNGQTLLWRKARYVDPSLGSEGSAGIPFGLALPHGYTAGAGQEYPLVIYLHGAGARGDDDNQNLQRPTARFFAHQARTEPAFNAFVLSPQVAVGQQFVNVAFDHGPYEQSATTLTASMQLTENLVLYLTNPANNASLGALLGFSAAEVDTSRVYLVGDSMGAYGAWDTLGRGSVDYSAAIAAAGSGPVNRLAAILGTPLWVIHGEVDGVVPNFLAYLGDPDGAGSLGMLGLIDPAFENTTSTALIRLDNYASAADDPTLADTLIYSQYPAQFTHATVAGDWTGTMVSDFSSWLFAQVSTGSSASQQAVRSGFAPRLELAWDSIGGGWYLIWPDAQWVLQETMSLDEDWIDVFPPASSPHPVEMEETGDQRFFRLRAAGQE